MSSQSSTPSRVDDPGGSTRIAGETKKSGPRPKNTTSSEKKRARDRKAQRHLREKRLEYVRELEAKVAEQNALIESQEVRIRELVGLVESLPSQHPVQNETLQMPCHEGLPMTPILANEQVELPNPCHLGLDASGPRADDETNVITTTGSSEVYGQNFDLEKLQEDSNVDCNARPVPPYPIVTWDHNMQDRPLLKKRITSTLVSRDNIFHNTPELLAKDISYKDTVVAAFESTYQCLEDNVEAWCAPEAANSPLARDTLEAPIRRPRPDKSMAHISDRWMSNLGIQDSSVMLLGGAGLPLKTREKGSPAGSQEPDQDVRRRLERIERLIFHQSRWQYLPPVKFVDDGSIEYCVEYLLRTPALLYTCEEVPRCLDLLYGSQENILANCILQAINQYSCPEPETLASGWLQYLITKWRTQPSPERFARIPEFLRPVGAQLVVPHRACYDHLVWPRLRQNLIQYGHRYSTDEVFELFASCLRVRWPRNESVLELDREGNLTIKKEFLSLIFTEDGWGLRAEFFLRYQDLVEGLDASKVLYTVD